MKRRIEIDFAYLIETSFNESNANVACRCIAFFIDNERLFDDYETIKFRFIDKIQARTN